MTNDELVEALSKWPGDFKVDIYLAGCGSENLDIQISPMTKRITIFEPEMHLLLQESEQTPEQTPEERRNAGQSFCPKCSTFGHTHSKGCPFANSGMLHHVTRT